MFLQSFIVLLFRILQFAIFLRIILSWVSPVPRHGSPIHDILWQITEPILGPLRRYTTFGMIDLSPLVALVGMQIIEGFLLQLVARIG